METLILSRLADLIIVLGAVGLVAAAIGTVAADAIYLIVKKVGKALEKRRVEKQ